LVNGDVLRRREDLRGVLEVSAGEPRIDHARIFDVVVSENSARDKKMAKAIPGSSSPMAEVKNPFEARMRKMLLRGLKLYCLARRCPRKGAVLISRTLAANLE